MADDSLSRREFLRHSALAGAGLVTAGWLSACSREPSARAMSVSGAPIPSAVGAVPAQGAPAASPVAVLRHSGLNTADSLDEKVVAGLLEAGIKHVTGASDPGKGWAKIAGPSDVVCIKVNCIAGPMLSTHPVLVAGVCDCLTTAGVKPENIIIWEAYTGALSKGGYTVNQNGPGIRCYGTDRDYAGPFTYGQFSGNLSRILAEKATVLVNMPILKNHGASGVTAAMKNHYGSIDKPSACHGNGCDPYIAHISMLDPIRQKTRLIICDASRACYNGGPGARPQFMWQYSGILMAQDPVALDTVAWQIVDQKRSANGLRGSAPAWLATAASLGLGTNNVSQMSLLDKDLG
jgi:uncharacterized protein (DUF362 family)